MDRLERTTIYDLNMVRKNDKLRRNMLRYRNICHYTDSTHKESGKSPYHLLWHLQAKKEKNDFEAEHLAGMTEAQKQQYLLATGDLAELMWCKRKNFNQ